MSEKKNDKKPQTKAGMLGKSDSQSKDKKDKTTLEKDPENTPKISKREAEGQHDDSKPLH